MEVPVLLPKVFDHPFTYTNSSKNKKSQSRRYSCCSIWQKKGNRSYMGQNKKY